LFAPNLQAKILTRDAYRRYIYPLFKVTSFGASYYEDGAADASLLFPESSEPPYDYRSPAMAFVTLSQLGERSLPLLIDCLSDGRITRMRSSGNTIIRSMNVSDGHVCLDSLMREGHGNPASDTECGDDG
jgi:hypothetical protein